MGKAKLCRIEGQTEDDRSLVMDEYLRNTDVIDSGNESVRIKSRELTEGVETDIEKARLLFYFVRDQIKFNMYAPTQQRKDHMASTTLRCSVQEVMSINPA